MAEEKKYLSLKNLYVQDHATYTADPISLRRVSDPKSSW